MGSNRLELRAVTITMLLGVLALTLSVVVGYAHPSRPDPSRRRAGGHHRQIKEVMLNEKDNEPLDKFRASPAR